MPELSMDQGAHRRWKDASLRRLSIAVLIALSAAVAIAFWRGPEHSGLLRTGDFPGFYAPAFTVISGRSERLYDFELQRELQNRFFPNDRNAFYISVYPPYFCMIFAPIGLLPPHIAKIVATVLMVLFLLWSMRLASGFTPALRRYRFELTALIAASPPLLFSLAAAQNTALSLLLYTGALYLFKRSTSEGDFGAGMLLGAWLFKPQYGLPAMLLPMLAGRWWMAAGAALPIAAYAVTGYLLLGSDWPAEWAAAASRFGTLNYDVNGHQMVSLVGALRTLGAQWGPEARWWLTAIGWALAAVLGLLTAYQFLKVRTAPPEQAGAEFERAFLRMAPAVLMFAPQTLFYDLGIAAIAVVHCLTLRTDREISCLLLVLTVMYGATLLREPGGLPLQLPFAVLACWFVWRRTAPGATLHAGS